MAEQMFQVLALLAFAVGRQSFTSYQPRMYIDPGAGSLAIQAIGAGIIAVLSTVTRVRRFVRSAVERLRRK